MGFKNTTYVETDNIKHTLKRSSVLFIFCIRDGKLFAKISNKPGNIIVLAPWKPEMKFYRTSKTAK